MLNDGEVWYQAEGHRKDGTHLVIGPWVSFEEIAKKEIEEAIKYNSEDILEGVVSWKIRTIVDKGTQEYKS